MQRCKEEMKLFSEDICLYKKIKGTKINKYSENCVILVGFSHIRLTHKSQSLFFMPDMNK